MLTFVLRKINKYIAQKADVTTRNDFYYSKIYFKRIGFLYNIYNSKKSDGSLCNTGEIIRPLGLRFGMKCKEVLSQFKKPSFVYDNKLPSENHKVALIRQSIDGISMLVQFQFFDDQLFFIGLDISRSLNKPEDKSIIINTIIQKYLNKPFVTGEEYPVIQDNDGDFIIINDDVNFSICYLSGSLSRVRNYISQKGGMSPAPSISTKESLFYAF